MTFSVNFSNLQLQLKSSCSSPLCNNIGTVNWHRYFGASNFVIDSRDQRRLATSKSLQLHCAATPPPSLNHNVVVLHKRKRFIRSDSSSLAWDKKSYDAFASIKSASVRARVKEEYSTKKRGLGAKCRLDENLEVGSEIDYNLTPEDELQHTKSRTSSLRRSRAPRDVVETTNESGYVIKVSKELMGVFQYVEKVKRARLKELSETLRQVAVATFFFSFVKGVITPLVEVFKTNPPAWGRMILTLGAFDAFAITYLAMKALEPLDRLSSLATECNTEADMMGSIEKEEELMLALAIDLVRLFRRLRNLAFCTAITQFAHILHAMLRLQQSYPNFAINIIKFVKSWLSTPWV